MSKVSKDFRHVVIPDCQIKEGVDYSHLIAAARLIVKLKPDHIINIGDFWDMPSLSSYDMGKAAAEGARYIQDIKSGNKAMRDFMRIINEGIRRSNNWTPKLHFCMGNHEQRIKRHVESNPHLVGWLSYDDFHLKGWEVYDFLEVAEIDGIHYSHYFANPMSGRPYGGSIQNMLQKIGFSFTQGHVQKLDFGRKDLCNGQVIQAVVAGAFYTHLEGYKGHQGNHHWRGLIVKHHVRSGNYDLETYSVARLMKEFDR